MFYELISQMIYELYRKLFVCILSLPGIPYDTVLISEMIYYTRGPDNLIKRTRLLLQSVTYYFILLYNSVWDLLRLQTNIGNSTLWRKYRFHGWYWDQTRGAVCYARNSILSGDKIFPRKASDNIISCWSQSCLLAIFFVRSNVDGVDIFSKM